MGYTYAIDTKAMFKDRFEQFVTLGIPRAEVQEMADVITEMWADLPAAGRTNGQGWRNAT